MKISVVLQLLSIRHIFYCEPVFVNYFLPFSVFYCFFKLVTVGQCRWFKYFFQKNRVSAKFRKMRDFPKYIFIFPVKIHIQRISRKPEIPVCFEKSVLVDPRGAIWVGTEWWHSPVTLLQGGARTVGCLEAVKTSTAMTEGLLWPQ